MKMSRFTVLVFEHTQQLMKLWNDNFYICVACCCEGYGKYVYNESVVKILIGKILVKEEREGVWRKKEDQNLTFHA